MSKKNTSIELASLINKYRNIIKACHVIQAQTETKIEMCRDIIESLEETQSNIKNDKENN